MFRRCQHNRTRCIHGDEGWARMKVYLRWWKEPVVRRQACLDCGAALDRGPICTRFGTCRHEGPWIEPPATPASTANGACPTCGACRCSAGYAGGIHVHPGGGVSA